MEMINELIQNALHSSPQGFLGVGGIFVYMSIIVVIAFYRIFKGDHLDH